MLITRTRIEKILEKIDITEEQLQHAKKLYFYIHSGVRNGRSRERALAWINSNSERDGGFIKTCEALHLKPEDVRKMFLRTKEYTETMRLEARRKIGLRRVK